MEETELVVRRAAASGDADERLEAFAELVRRFQDMAYGYAYALLGDFHLAEDVAQEAFLTAYQRLGQVREPRAFPGWLRRIVQTQADRLTRRRVKTDSVDLADPIADGGASPAEAAEAAEIRQQVLRAVRALPEAQRTVTTLFYINGYSQKDIAGFLEVPGGTVRSRLRAARNRLKHRTMAMVDETFKSHRPSPEQRRAIIDELMSRKVQFDEEIGGWKPSHSQRWAKRWHDRRMEDVRANAAAYGIEPDETLPRMVAEYHWSHTFRDDFLDVPRRWAVPEGTELILLREFCRGIGATPLAVQRWAAESLPVVRYHPWQAYDPDRAQPWVEARGIRPGERMSAREGREPLLVTLRTLAAGEASVGEAGAVVSALWASTYRIAPRFGDADRIDPEQLDPLWAKQWRARWPAEQKANARQYGLAEPAGDNRFGVPAEMMRERLFEIRDLCRRLRVDPFDVIRWTGEGMPCVRLSPWLRWDAEHTAAWLADRGSLPAGERSPDELDNLVRYVLSAVAAGQATPEAAREVFTGWAALM